MSLQANNVSGEKTEDAFIEGDQAVLNECRTVGGEKSDVKDM
jgi:hypothetical protein